ncbi:MAG: Na+/H+ antiporter NhaC family protein [Salibacteraceae bacterium]
MNRPSFGLAVLPLLFLIVLLAANVFIFGDDSLSFPNQIALLAAAGIAAIVGKYVGAPNKHLMDGVVENIGQAVPALLVLLLIGSLAASWLLSGIVPAMIYYGLALLNPDWFLVSACIICAVVSIATGSSWGTIATVGIALLGIGKAMGYSEGIIAGAIISGAYFGDKMSPLSDTTNLAPAVSGTDLFTHIRYMTVTTIPSILITLIMFGVIGFFYNPSSTLGNVDSINQNIETLFHISPWLFLVPLVVIGLIIKKMPAAPALGIGALLGLLAAFIFQGELVENLATTEGSLVFYELGVVTIGNGISIDSSDPLLSELLSTSGMKGMLGTVWLIVCAMAFGGVMARAGCLETISNALLKLATGRTSLIGTTALSSIFMNLTASDQYLAIVVPGKMYEEAYKKQGLHPANLSRTLEDAGTVTSVLIPWNTCGATQAGVLGVATAVYWPFCFFCLLSPLMTFVVSALNIKVKTLSSTQP